MKYTDRCFGTNLSTESALSSIFAPKNYAKKHSEVSKYISGVAQRKLRMINNSIDINALNDNTGNDSFNFDFYH